DHPAMSQREVRDLAKIVEAIEDAFPSLVGQSEVKKLLSHSNIVFDEFVRHGTTFKDTMLDILRELNSQDGAVLKKVLQDLFATNRPVIVKILTPLISKLQDPERIEEKIGQSENIRQLLA